MCQIVMQLNSNCIQPCLWMYSGCCLFVSQLCVLSVSNPHSTFSLSLSVYHTRLSTVSDRSFPVAAARTWNIVTQHVTSTAMSFPRSPQDVPSHDFHLNICSACAMRAVIFEHFNNQLFYLLIYSLVPSDFTSCCIFISLFALSHETSLS